MFGLEILEVGIGLILLFLITSLMCTAAFEMIELVLKARGLQLEKGIRELLAEDPKALQAFYSHAQIFSLYKGKAPAGAHERLGRKHPSYIPSRNFAVALLDLAAQGKTNGKLDPAGIRDGVGASALPDSAKRAVLNALDLAEGKIDRAVDNVADWYDGSMDRVSGWFKRHTQRVQLGLGLALAIGLNIDAIEVAKRLNTDETLRAAVVREAESRTAPPAAAGVDGSAPPVEAKARAEPGATFTALADPGSTVKPPAEIADPSPSDALKQARSDLRAIGYPIGWPAPQLNRPECRQPGGCGSQWPRKAQMALGWLLTALAVTLGAPFWFDLLNKFMVVRSTVKPKEKSPDEDSEDRQRSGLPSEITLNLAGKA